MKLRFLCGCSSHLLDTPIENRLGVIDSFDAITFDEQGFIVCSIHHQRRYGWRAPSPAAGKGIRYMTDLEFQQKTLFGIDPPRRIHLQTNVPTADLRPRVPAPHDIRRAIEQACHAVAMRKTNGKVSNGHAFRENLERVEAEIVRTAHR